MAHQLIKQPDGNYCLFSEQTHLIILRDATPQAVFAFWCQQAKDDFDHQSKAIKEQLDQRLRQYQDRVGLEVKALNSDVDMDTLYPLWVMDYKTALKRHTATESIKKDKSSSKRVRKKSGKNKSLKKKKKAKKNKRR